MLNDYILRMNLCEQIHTKIPVIWLFLFSHEESQNIEYAPNTPKHWIYYKIGEENIMSLTQKFQELEMRPQLPKTLNT